MNRGNAILMGRVEAGVELLSRTGAKEFELTQEQGPVQWWAGANWGGTRMFSERFPYPAHAVEDLVERVVNGGSCTRCRETTVVGIMLAGYCCFTLTAGDVDDPQTYRWVRSCEVGAS